MLECCYIVGSRYWLVFLYSCQNHPLNRHVVFKLVLFTLLMFSLPFAAYYASLKYLWSGKWCRWFRLDLMKVPYSRATWLSAQEIKRMRQVRLSWWSMDWWSCLFWSLFGRMNGWTRPRKRRRRGRWTRPSRFYVGIDSLPHSLILILFLYSLWFRRSFDVMAWYREDGRREDPKITQKTHKQTQQWRILPPKVVVKRTAAMTMWVCENKGRIVIIYQHQDILGELSLETESHARWISTYIQRQQKMHCPSI